MVCFLLLRLENGKSTTQEFVSLLTTGPEIKLGPTFSLQCAFGCQLESENTKLSKTWLLLLDEMVYVLTFGFILVRSKPIRVQFRYQKLELKLSLLNFSCFLTYLGNVIFEKLEVEQNLQKIFNIWEQIWL